MSNLQSPFADLQSPIPNLPMARVGVVFDQAVAAQLHAQGRNTFQLYLREVLGHAGVPFAWFDSLQAALRRPRREPPIDLLIVALAGDDEATAQALAQYAEQGGVVIALANLPGAADLLGCKQTEMGVGYAVLDDGQPLRFLAAAPWIVERQAPSVRGYGELRRDSPAGEVCGPAIVRCEVGRGFIERWAVDVPTTIVHLQQGLGPVVKDGLPAPDGSGPIDEGILKADDGFALDWELDRARTETGQPYFAHPYADLWREAFVGRLLRLALERGLALPLLDYWPHGVPQVAMISHDSDLNTDDSAETTLGILKELGLRSTWCLIEPGYSPRIYEQALADGHELAFHYNAVVHEGFKWDADDFKRQFEWMKRATGLPAVVSNKNHYTRFEGWGDLFRWLEAAGIQADQTRGPSKRGNVGLLFATCHPHFAIAWHDEGNRLYDVMEIGFLTQDMDLGSWADSSVIAPFLEQVQRVRGVAHFLFHPVHLHAQEKVRAAIQAVVRQARERGFVFWTSRQINDWVRARRALRVEGIDDSGAVVLSGAGKAGPAASQAAAWLPASAGSEGGPGLERRFGVWCRRADKVLVS